MPIGAPSNSTIFTPINQMTKSLVHTKFYISPNGHEEPCPHTLHQGPSIEPTCLLIHIQMHPPSTFPTQRFSQYTTLIFQGLPKHLEALVSLDPNIFIYSPNHDSHHIWLRHNPKSPLSCAVCTYQHQNPIIVPIFAERFKHCIKVTLHCIDSLSHDNPP